MKKFYKISIPEPCHEDWNLMAPSEKGRFCDSCTKMVIDFTKMSEMQIQDFINKNQDNKICGHFKAAQLDTIHISIPIEIIKTQHSLKTSFLLAFLLVMGTTLISCTNHEGKKQKIEHIQIINDVKTDPCTTTLPTSATKKTICSNSSEASTAKENVITTTHISNTLGEVIPPEKEIDSLNEDFIEGDIELYVPMGFIIPTEVTDLNKIVPTNLLDTFPAFIRTKKEQRTKETFSEQIRTFVSKNFDKSIGQGFNLKGVQRIYSRFEIDKKGLIQNLKIRSSHPNFEEEAKRVIKKLPRFIPGTYQNQPVRTTYNLPIVFKIEE